VRLLDAGRTDKTDPHDARSAAIVALGHAGLRTVAPVDHTAVLRLLADRHHDLVALRTQAVCRLHALLCLLTPGGTSRQLSALRAGHTLRAIRPADPVAVERERVALDSSATSVASTTSSTPSRNGSPSRSLRPQRRCSRSTVSDRSWRP
jgi:hypothetical protein